VADIIKATSVNFEKDREVINELRARYERLYNKVEVLREHNVTIEKERDAARKTATELQAELQRVKSAKLLPKLDEEAGRADKGDSGKSAQTTPEKDKKVSTREENKEGKTREKGESSESKKNSSTDRGKGESEEGELRLLKELQAKLEKEHQKFLADEARRKRQRDEKEEQWNALLRQVSKRSRSVEDGDRSPEGVLSILEQNRLSFRDPEE
jgi:chromosome segregation ATPase